MVGSVVTTPVDVLLVAVVVSFALGFVAGRVV